NSWPNTTSRARSMTKAAPARRATSTSWAACWRAWRSEPQIPQASVLTSTCPFDGVGSASWATTRSPSRNMAARSCPPPIPSASALQERRRPLDRLFEAGALEGDAFRKSAQESRRHLRVEQHEDAAVIGAAHQAAEGLLQPEPRDHVVIAR